MELYENWWEETRSAYLYGVMAQYEKNALHQKLFKDLQGAALKQAGLWEKKMQQQQLPPPVFKPDFRTRLVAGLIKLIGPESLHYILSAMKIRGMAVFTRYHSEHRHTGMGAASNLRAAIFGVSDGLVSNSSLILGVAAASTNQHYIVLTGIAGLLAGACSMGAGEYISVRSQREVFEYQIAIEKQELEEYPEEEIEELTMIYTARGLPPEEANKLAKLMISNPETGLNALVREELGLNPEELVSPIGAMLASFISFAFGAIVPLLPFLFNLGSNSLIVSIALTGVTLFAIGAVLSLFTNRNPFFSGFRMFALGALAGASTYFIGHWIGVSM